MTRAGTCPFCPPDEAAVFLRGDSIVALWDRYPVSEGHALIVPIRHVEGWLEVTPGERAELLGAVENVRAVIETHHQPAGFNIGINVGSAAGQTVPHVHIHVIPRYTGDVADPRGGVRHVIPTKGNYLLPVPDVADARVRSALVTGGTDDPLLPRLLAHLAEAVSVDIATAFTMRSGLLLVEEHLRDLLDRGGRLRFLTGDYLGVTEPEALFRLLDLDGDVEVRIFESGGTSFHPKAYIVSTGIEQGAAFVGSSNLTATALRTGVEWNYQVTAHPGTRDFDEISLAFDGLWSHEKSRPLDSQWIDDYKSRRTRAAPQETGLPVEVQIPPEPHAIQLQALSALEATRKNGNTAGLVVLATGLGKTWLSAFDSQASEYKRILFVAHREEILRQAMRTFRRIRPFAKLGIYKSAERAPDADIVFASIQTLNRRAHLHRFDPHEFDYIVMDEFHHAAAQSYRRVISYFEPKFLLGLTATPERTDGADLLTLCGNNLVFRADVSEGLEHGLLCPFDYFGVPDVIDYDNIPWRSSRFDEEALTDHAATDIRARNALEQLEKHGGERTIAFCVSQRHADFMAEFFNEQGLRAVAVHSGPSSAPRARSLEQLEAGELNVVCSVDMFNEGVDLPHVDTILMLRPTESRILWLQQFGRGLRFLPEKTLRVIDYIGNHRIFLTKIRALLELGAADRDVAFALDQLGAGELELPPGCSVTYELEAQDILRSLLRTTPAGEQLEEYYRDFRELHGARPLASEAFHDGYSPRSTRRAGHGSWLDFVESMGDLSEEHRQVRSHIGTFLDQLEVTPMTKSYKMLVLQGMLGEGVFPGSIHIRRLSERFGDLARRRAPLRSELGYALDDPERLLRTVRENPVSAWAGGAGTGATSYFNFENDIFSTVFTLPEELREAGQELVEELVEWRLAEYLQRSAHGGGPDRFVCRVSHSGGRPILFLPDRDRTPGIPEGWVEVLVGDRRLQVNFVKVAVNVVTEPGSKENILPDILRGWFGPNAGTPGRTDQVMFEVTADGYRLAPHDATQPERTGPEVWQSYSRKAAIESLDIVAKGWDKQVGILDRPDQVVLFVTLDKRGKAETMQYEDRFLSPYEFHWQSQNKNTQSSELGQKLRDHEERGIPVHLFVRKKDRIGGTTQPFIYAGRLRFRRWEGEKPITVWWELEEGVPERLRGELGVPTDSGGRSE